MTDQSRILIELAKTVLALEKRIKALETPQRLKVGDVLHVGVMSGSIGEIVAGVAEAHRIDFKMIMGRCTSPTFSWPRQQAYAMCAKAGYTNGAIGRFFDRDRGTIRDGIEAHNLRAADQ